MYFFRKIPWANKALHLAVPGIVYHAIPTANDHPRVSEHVLDTFDWYSPKYQSKHTYPEVFSWFEEAGLERIRVLPHPVGMSGRKPVADAASRVVRKENSKASSSDVRGNN